MVKCEPKNLPYGLSRVGIARTDEVLPFRADSKHAENSERDFLGHMIKMWSLRYHTFAKSLSCVACGIKGEFFAIERHVKQQGTRYHLNLYAIDINGEEMLMTKDHIVPKVNGGVDEIENMQTMCAICNRAKGANAA